MELAYRIPRAVPSASATWINGPRWDIGWLIGSAIIVPVVLVFVWAGVSSAVLNLGITAVIGGPHLFATYTATFMDPGFRRAHRWGLLIAALAVPTFVIYWTLVDFQILLSVFIFAASVHVLHQNAYITDVYRKRAGFPEPGWSRLNPAARTPGSPIHGMPILEAFKARNVIVNKRSMATGYAGLDNDLFYMDKTMMVFGDAKKIVDSIVKAID